MDTILVSYSVFFYHIISHNIYTKIEENFKQFLYFDQADTVNI